jgi:hypothetical protein
MQNINTLVLFAATTLLVACGQGQPAATNSGTAAATAPIATAPVQSTHAPVATTAATQPAPSDDAKQAIIDAVSALETAGPYRVTQRLEGASGTTEIVVEVVPPDKRRMLLSGGVEIITIGARRWDKTGDTWTEMPNEGALPPAGLSREQMADGLVNNAQHLGTEDLGGTPANVYSFAGAATTDEARAAQTANVWVDVEHGLPLRVDSQVVVEGITTRMTMTYEYSDAIVIEPPTA